MKSFRNSHVRFNAFGRLGFLKRKGKLTKNTKLRIRTYNPNPDSFNIHQLITPFMVKEFFHMDRIIKAMFWLSVTVFAVGVIGFFGLITLTAIPALHAFENLLLSYLLASEVVFGLGGIGLLVFELVFEASKRHGPDTELGWLSNLSFDQYNNNYVFFLNKFYRSRFARLSNKLWRYLSFGKIRLDRSWTVEYGDLQSIISMLQANPQAFYEIAEIAQNKEELKQMMGVR